MKIRIVNKTSESTSMLRNLVKLVAQKKGIISNIEATFLNGHRIHGRAYVGSVAYLNWTFNPRLRVELGLHKSLKIWLPANWKETLITVLQVMEHEFDHTLGLRHKDMCKYTDISIAYEAEARSIIGIKEIK